MVFQFEVSNVEHNVEGTSHATHWLGRKTCAMVGQGAIEVNGMKELIKFCEGLLVCLFVMTFSSCSSDDASTYPFEQSPHLEINEAGMKGDVLLVDFNLSFKKGTYGLDWDADRYYPYHKNDLLVDVKDKPFSLELEGYESSHTPEPPFYYRYPISDTEWGYEYFGEELTLPELNYENCEVYVSSHYTEDGELDYWNRQPYYGSDIFYGRKNPNYVNLRIGFYYQDNNGNWQNILRDADSMSFPSLISCDAYYVWRIPPPPDLYDISNYFYGFERIDEFTSKFQFVPIFTLEDFQRIYPMSEKFGIEVIATARNLNDNQRIFTVIDGT